MKKYWIEISKEKAEELLGTERMFQRQYDWVGFFDNEDMSRVCFRLQNETLKARETLESLCPTPEEVAERGQITTNRCFRIFTMRAMQKLLHPTVDYPEYKGQSFDKCPLKDGDLGVWWNGVIFSKRDLNAMRELVPVPYHKEGTYKEFIDSKLIKLSQKKVFEYMEFRGINPPATLDSPETIIRREWTFMNCDDDRYKSFDRKIMNPYNPDWHYTKADPGHGTPLDFQGDNRLQLPEGFAGGSYHSFMESADAEPCTACGCPKRIRKINIAYASNGAVNPGHHITNQIFCRWCGA